MKTPSESVRKGKYGPFISRIIEPDPFFREMILVFYGLYVFFFLAYNAFDNNPLVQSAYQFATAISLPGILFAMGFLFGKLNFNKPETKGKLLSYALIFYSYYAITGILLHVIAYEEECFKTIKNILFAILIPADSGVFLTCTVLCLIMAFFGAKMEEAFINTRLRRTICLAGLLTTLIPAGAIGYGLFGILIGGDVAGAVPIAYYLPALIWGMICAKEGDSVIASGRTYKLIILMAISGIAFYFLHLKNLSFVLLGTGAAFVILWVLRLLKPVYLTIENWFAGIFRPLYRTWESEKEKSLPGTKRYYIYYFAGYTLLFALISFLIFVPYINGGYSLIWESDGLGQYVPKAYRFVRDMPGVVRDLLHGNMNFKQYDFGVGLGSAMSYSFDPIYWLYLLAGESRIEAMYNAAVILRYFLAGISMSCLIFFFKKDRRAAYVASFVYVYSGYALFAGTRHSQFITPIILFPLLVIAMERLIRYRKWYMMTVLVALSLFCSYYFLYMNTIAVGIYFLLRILLTGEYRNIKTFISRGLIITGSYVLGTGIAFLSLVTSFGGYLGSSRSGGADVASLITNNALFYRSEWLIDIAAALFTSDFGPGQWLRIGMVPMVLFVLVLIFTKKDQKLLSRAFLICVIFCIFPIFGYIMSGFASVTNRWVYIFTALLAFILAWNFDRLTSLTKKELAVMTGIAGSYLLLMLIGLKFRTTGIQGSLVLMVASFALILLLNHPAFDITKKNASRILFVFIMFTVIINGNLFVTRIGTETGGLHIETYVPSGTSDATLKNCSMKYLHEVKGYDKNGYVRSDNLRNTSLTRNSAMILDYNSIATFTSTLAGGIVDYNREMGNNAWNIVTVYDYNFRTYMNELASVKYLGRRIGSKATMPPGFHKVYENKSPEGNYEIYENRLALPVGYSYDRVIPESEVSSLGAIDKQETTMLAAITEDNDTGRLSGAQVAKKADLPLTSKEIKIKEIKTTAGLTYEEGLITINDIDDAKMSFSFKSLPNSETYLVFEGDVVPVDDSREIEINGQCIAPGINCSGRFRLDNYSTGQKEYVYNLGYHKKSIEKCSFVFETDGQLLMKSIRIYSLPMDSYEDRVKALKEISLTDVKQTTNELSGKISTDRDRFLVLSLPYQSGWTALVDGKETRIYRANYQYMGINLPRGDHQIRMVYRIPGIKAGFMISGGAVVIFLLIILGNAVRKRRKHIRS